MAKGEWYFTKEQLANSPSRRCGIDADKELSYRQQAANFIQDMGQRLTVSQLCINTAIVYMHRFYVFHSLTQFHRNSIASAALFLAAKVEEQPRKLEHVIKVSHMCLHRDQPMPDVKSDDYLQQAQDLVFNENVLLQTLGFDVAIDHPHTHVVQCCQLVKASKDLGQTSYFMASNSLHLTTMCLQYKPKVVACFCIHLACKWSNWEIPQSKEGKPWFWYVDQSVTAELLQQLTAEFLHIFDRCPTRLRKKIMSISEKQSPSLNHPSLSNSPFDMEPRKVQSPAPDSGPMFQSSRPFPTDEDKKKSASMQPRTSADYHHRDYKDKKDVRERDKQAGTSSSMVLHPQEQVKHHPHYHKQPSTSSSGGMASSAVPGPLPVSIASKHTSAVNQKAPAIHNNHHRPDLKQPQPMQRHTSSSQPRDAARQRLPREYSAPQTSGQHPAYPHAHATTLYPNNPAKDVNPSVDGVAVTDSGASGVAEPTSHHGLTVEKLSNNNNNHHSHAHRLVQHEKRAFDPRQKIPEHRKDEQLQLQQQQHQLQQQQQQQQQLPQLQPQQQAQQQQKNYGKYMEQQQRTDRQRKVVDSLEQRSEEVRKLMEKPLPPPKPRTELQNPESIANLLKSSSHYTKCVDEKVNATQNFNRSLTGHEFNKAVPNPKPVGALQHSHGVTQILKDMKNGIPNASGMLSNTMDEPKAEKRPMLDDPAAHVVPTKMHRSLFSPENVTSARDVHIPRSKPVKQKTPPVPIKTIKLERPDMTHPGPDMISPFNNPLVASQSTVVSMNSQLDNQRRGKIPGYSEPEPLPKVKEPRTDDSSRMDVMQMLGRIRMPPLLPPMRETSRSTNGRSCLTANNLKMPEMVKPLEPEPQQQQQPNMRHTLTNGVDLNVNREDELAVERLENSLQMKPEYLSPMKSAQSISALLQEPLAPMPSLLQCQSSGDSGIYSSSQLPSSGELEMISINPELMVDNCVVSTVDMSALSAPVATIPEVTVSVPGPETKKSDHHKSEKKKKKEKHKHKDKDKSKEKHKHKHKEKDKEKHRDKDKDSKDREKDRVKSQGKERVTNVERSEETTAPIRITIPKNVLNFNAESNMIVEKKSPPSSGLKIKIPKERLKESAAPGQASQGPIKLKLPRPSAATLPTEYPESRKRERETLEVSGGSALKKTIISGSPAPATFTAHQVRAHERQNGRHYSSTSNNKEKHSSREHKSSSKTSQSHTT